MANTHQELRGQSLLPNERVQAAWFVLQTQIMGGASKKDVREHDQKAMGYIDALRDAELIDAADFNLMATIVLRALNDALERLHNQAD
jgi:hypothetical protein